MKNKGKMRILALVLCMVVMLSNSSFIFASGETETAAAAPETTAVTPEPEVSAASELAELPTPEPTAEPTEAPTPEPTAEPTPEASAAPEPTEVPTPEVSAAPEPTAEPTPEASAAPEPTEVPTPEASASPTPAAEQDIGSEESAAVTPTPEAEPEPDGSSEEIVLEGSCGDTTVILSGPASSFPEGTELSILVQEPAEEDQEVIEEAVEKQAEEQEMEVKSYTALDIRLLSNGEEIQPLGPVSVKFQQPEQQERTAEETSTQVLHVDESTGDATDMEAEVAEDGEVAIETTHFSIYVVVDLEELGGEIELTVQHWATVEQLVGESVVGTGITGLVEHNKDNNSMRYATLQSKEVFTSIYAADQITLYNQSKTDVKELSKILLRNTSEVPNYELIEIWCLKDSSAADSESSTGWEVYKLKKEDGKENDATIQLTENATIRMVYEPEEADDNYKQDVAFYDYNVTGGGVKIDNPTGKPVYDSCTLYQTDLGINAWENTNLGIGNAGFPSSKKFEKFNGKYLNQGNGSGELLQGMVTGITDKGPVFADGINAGDLFNNEEADGKKIIDDYQLSFNQEGDVYTLSSVWQNGKEVAGDYETLKYLTNKWAAKPEDQVPIYSNSFWPLDTYKYDGRDPLFGQSGTEWRGISLDIPYNGHSSYEGMTGKNNINPSAISESDDKKEHNFFFGMRFDFEFTIGDYEGPLNFYFRGDDDFWLFVDDGLKVDLGGIHSSYGQYLDLNYLRENEDERDKTHKVSIVYAERGAYGSTCYMQFTLPNVKPVSFEPDSPKTSVKVDKVWEDHNNPNRPASIQVELHYKEKTGNEWRLFETITLSPMNNWQYTWTELPAEGYDYKVKEVGEKDGKFGKYEVIYSEKGGVLKKNGDGTYSGTITNRASPSTEIIVTKEWDDDGNASGARPDSVDFFLYYRNPGEADWKPYPDGKLTLTETQKWKGSYTNLPVYAGDTDKPLEYTVMEISGDDPLMEGGKLPGKNTGQEKFQYTVSYDKENHCGTGKQWTGYAAEANGITLDLTVTNSLGREIEVIKQWKGTLESKIPDSIYVGLYLKNSEGVEKPVSGKTLQLTKAGGWKGSFKYLGEGDYTVKELQETTDSGPADFTIDDTKKYIGINDGGSVTIKDVEYDVTYSHSQGTATNNKTTYYTITNQGSWQIIKKSKSGDLFLEGAEFTLTLDGSNQVYTGTSAETTGLVTWQGVDIATIDSGTYTLTEKTAPIGYQPGGTWKITITNGVPTFVEKTNSDGSTDNTDKGKYVDGILTFYYENEALYALPDSGGTGIYGYVLGGMLFMTAAVLMLYKQRLGGGAGRKRR